MRRPSWPSSSPRSAWPIAVGRRLRIDFKPVEGPGGFEDPVRGAGNLARAFDVSYHAGATNTVHTGPGTPSTIVFTRVSE